MATLLNEKRPVGMYHLTFDASGLASGIYYYRLNVGAHNNALAQTRKMLLLK